MLTAPNPMVQPPFLTDLLLGQKMHPARGKSGLKAVQKNHTIPGLTIQDRFFTRQVRTAAENTLSGNGESPSLNLFNGDSIVMQTTICPEFPGN